MEPEVKEQEDVKEVETPESESSPEETEELVDSAGVPIKNRIAEQERKARQSLKRTEAEQLLTSQAETASTKDEAIKIVEAIADARFNDKIAPYVAKQFLLENPDAVGLIEEINEVRNKYPEIASVDRLDVAYKVAKAEKADAEIRLAEERGRNEAVKTKDRQEQSTIETGKAKPATSLDDRVKQASTVKELEELEAILTR